MSVNSLTVDASISVQTMMVASNVPVEAGISSIQTASRVQVKITMAITTELSFFLVFVTTSFSRER